MSGRRHDAERPQRVAILGATGSIGRQALDVIDRFPARFEVLGLVSGRRAPGRPARYVIQAGDPDCEARTRELVTHPDCDIVLVAFPGARALAPTLAALEAGKRIAIATKEVLVMAGEMVMGLAGGRDLLRPVDSEHSAIWQCLWGESPDSVARLIVTASGGPFWARPDLELDRVTVREALNHPRWSMGPKITVDSYPERLPGVVPPTRFHEVGSLELHQLDEVRFPSVRLCREAAGRGAPYPAVLNAANEEAVAAFLAERIGFPGIVALTESALGAFAGGGGSLEEILEADRFAREHVRSRLDGLPPASHRDRYGSGKVKR